VVPGNPIPLRVYYDNALGEFFVEFSEAIQTGASAVNDANTITWNVDGNPANTVAIGVNAPFAGSDITGQSSGQPTVLRFVLTTPGLESALEGSGDLGDGVDDLMDFAAGVTKDLGGAASDAVSNIVIQYRWTMPTTGTFTGSSLTDTIVGSSGSDVIDGSFGEDTITGGEGADTVAIGKGKDTVSLTETTPVADTLVWSTAFAAGNTNAATVTGFAFGVGADLIDINVAVANGTTVIGAGTGATNTLAALSPVAVASDGTATANDVIFTFTGVGDLLAAGTTIDTAVANAVTALTSGTDFSSANIDAGDSLILQMNDGTNTFVFHYVADGTPATTAATDLALIGVFSGTTVQALIGDFI
jgi:hypothetical protein